MAEISQKVEPSAEEKKAPITEEERIALCKKLDRELDEFINGLEKKRYTDGWSEDTWEEEMDKHPFFMKSNPGGEMSPLAEGLAKLKYDPEENTPEELAANYKEDGNFNFKHKNYRLAILGYSEGIRLKCDNPELNAALHNNRAAAHLHLKNYRSALIDSEKALSYKPDHTKARTRAAKCALEISKFDTCIQHSQKLKEIDPENKEVADLMKAAIDKKVFYERDVRRKQRRDEKQHEVVKAIIDRKIKIANCEYDELTLTELEPVLPDCHDAIVCLRKGILYWPLLLMYPEYKMTDLIRECPEDVPLIHQLEQVFPAPWDTENEYNINTISVYTESFQQLPVLVDPLLTLGDIMTKKYFMLKAGTPCFIIVVKGSASERRFLEGYFTGNRLSV